MGAPGPGELIQSVFANDKGTSLEIIPSQGTPIWQHSVQLPCCSSHPQTSLCIPSSSTSSNSPSSEDQLHHSRYQLRSGSDGQALSELCLRFKDLQPAVSHLTPTGGSHRTWTWVGRRQTTPRFRHRPHCEAPFSQVGRYPFALDTSPPADNQAAHCTPTSCTHSPRCMELVLTGQPRSDGWD